MTESRGNRGAKPLYNWLEPRKGVWIASTACLPRSEATSILTAPMKESAIKDQATESHEDRSYLARMKRKPGMGCLPKLGIAAGVVIIICIAIYIYCFSMPGSSFSGVAPTMTAGRIELRNRLESHVRALSQTIGPRLKGYTDTLQPAEDYVAGAFALAGYKVSRQEFSARGATYRNLVAELPGVGQGGEIIVIGAHYDSTGDTPGADDNASGVAGLIELARLLRENKLERTIRFVAFSNEEPPFFMTPGMGSFVYAKQCRLANEKVSAMLSLECIGYYSDEGGSQRYPFPLSAIYPDRGNFLAFVGDLGTRSLVRDCVRYFRERSELPSDGGVLPGSAAGVLWSDHWSFRQVDYPAIMATDTAFFRNRAYHTDEDTPDRLDYLRMALAVEGLAEVARRLAQN
ncbi:MAG: M28 family peptidase [Candidatus Brocadiia bacterium]